MSDGNTKYCPNCELEKSREDDFYNYSSGKTSDYCKECWPIVRKRYTPKARVSRPVEGKRPKQTEVDKYCKKCNDWKPLSEFYMVNGKYSGYCKTHQNEYRRELRRIANPGLKERQVNRAERAEKQTQGKKYCPKCGDYLPVSDFYKRGPDTNIYTSYCKKHHNEASSKRVSQTPLIES